MTILETRTDTRGGGCVRVSVRVAAREQNADQQARAAAVPEVWPLPRDVVVRRRRPVQSHRPTGAPLNYRGTGVLMSRASRRTRPITPVSTVLLALLAAGITLWLGLVAQAGGAATATETAVELPTRLSVVEVEVGETLQHIAQRVAPDAPVGPVVERIRELNKLESGAVRAGQTLIAPIG